MIITSELMIVLGQLALKYGVEMVKGLITIMHKENPTLQDWIGALDLAKNPIAQVVDGKIVVPGA